MLTHYKIEVAFVRSDAHFRVGQCLIQPAAIVYESCYILTGSEVEKRIHPLALRILMGLGIALTFPISLPATLIGVALLKDSKTTQVIERLFLSPNSVSTPSPHYRAKRRLRFTP